MTRFYAKMMLAFFILFFAAAAVIRAQPYDDSELRAFLTPPEGCPAPCLMGLSPGVTTAEEAFAALEMNEWVKNLHHSGYELTWNWTGQQSKFIQTTRPSVYHENEVLTLMRLDLNVRLWEVILILPPQNDDLEFIVIDRFQRAIFRVLHHTNWFDVISTLNCHSDSIMDGFVSIKVSAGREKYFGHERLSLKELEAYFSQNCR